MLQKEKCFTESMQPFSAGKTGTAAKRRAPRIDLAARETGLRTSSYVKARISELARESEMTEPMLYKHFGSKKGLFLAVLEEGSTQVLATFRECMWSQAEKDTQDALALIIDEDHAVMTADPEIQCIRFRAIIQAGDPEIARCVKKSFEQPVEKRDEGDIPVTNGRHVPASPHPIDTLLRRNEDVSDR